MNTFQYEWLLRILASVFSQPLSDMRGIAATRKPVSVPMFWWRCLPVFWWSYRSTVSSMSEESMHQESRQESYPVFLSWEPASSLNVAQDRRSDNRCRRVRYRCYRYVLWRRNVSVGSFLRCSYVSDYSALSYFQLQSSKQRYESQYSHGAGWSSEKK